MASSTNNNVNPQAQALKNQYPGASTLKSAYTFGNLGQNIRDTVYNSTIGAANKSLSNFGNSIAEKQTQAIKGTPTENLVNYLAGGAYDTNNVPFTPLNKGAQSSVTKSTPQTPIKQTATNTNPSNPSPATPTSSQSQTNGGQYVQTPNQNQGVLDSKGHNTSSWADNASTNETRGAQPNQGLYAQYTQQLANQYNSPYNQSAQYSINNLGNTATGNFALGQHAQDIAGTAGQQISNIGQEGAKSAAGYRTTGTTPVAQGRGAVVAQTTAAQQNAVTQGANMELAGNQQTLSAQGQAQSGYGTAAGQALTGQGQAQSALSNATGYAAPDANTSFYGDPLSGGIYGQGNNLVNQGISQAFQQASSGGNPVTLRAQILSQYGAPAAQAFDRMVMASKGGGYNPDAASAQVQQNTAFGQQTQGAAQSLNLALQSLKPVQQFATNFLSQSGINPTDAPVYNQPINQYISTLGNPAAATQWESIKNEIKTYANQILSSKQSANLPTTQDEQLAAQDPGNLSAKGLQAVFNTWDTLGGTNVGVLNNASQQAYGGSSGYTGKTPGFSQGIAPATPANSPGAGITNPLGQFGAGVGIDAAQAIGGIPAGVITGGTALLKLLSK